MHNYCNFKTLHRYTFIFVCSFIFNLSISGQNQISGIVQNNSGDPIEGALIVLEMTVPSTALDTIYSDPTGYFSKIIAVGLYEVRIYKNLYKSDTINSVNMYANNDLGIIILEKGGLMGPQSGVIPTGEYIVEDNLTVNKGDTLIIEAGTRLKFVENKWLTVYGTLICNGTENDTVFFTNAFEGKRWSGIRILGEESDSATFKADYTAVEFCNKSGVFLNYSKGEINNSAFRLNSQPYDYGKPYYGSGIRLEKARLVLSNSKIKDNSVAGGGGGIAANSSKLIILNCSISDNAAVFNGLGGGIYLNLGTTLIENSFIENNRASRFSNNHCRGGGMLISGEVLIRNSIIRNNSSTLRGGGIELGNDIFGDFSGQLILENSIVSGNSDGIYADDPRGKIIIRNSEITNNNLNGIEILTSPFSHDTEIYNSNISNNGTNGIMVSGNYDDVKVYNSIIALNGTVGLSLVKTVWNSLLYGNLSGNTVNCGSIGLEVTTNVNGDPVDPYMNVLADPLFVDAASQNYLLQPASPAIDAGSNTYVSVPSDLDGNIRIWDGNSDGTAIVDVGPYEYGAPFLASSDISLQSLDWPKSGCELNASEQVQITLKNYGTVGEKGFSVSYSLDNGASFVVETCNDSIPPGASVTFTFAQASDFSQIGDLDIIVAISVTGDETPENDTLRRTISHYQLEAIISDSTNISCYQGANGTATVTATGAPGPIFYQWDDDFARNTPKVTGLKANVLYTVNVTTNDRCHTSASVKLSQPEELTMNLVELNKATCNSGMDDGSVTVEGLGGTPPYSYVWDDASSTSGPVLENMTPNIWYHVLITDALGCTAFDSAKVTEANKLVTIFPVANDASCFGLKDGSAEVAVYFGTEPYSYQWDNDPGSDTRAIQNLAGGRYYRVSVLDDKGCAALDSVYIKEPEAISASYILAHNSCYGDQLGGINMSVTGGTGDYSFQWSNSAETDDIVGLAAGKYMVEITDVNNCIFKDTVEILQPEEIVLAENTTHVSCNGMTDGSIDLSVTGGMPTYTVSWTDGENGTNRQGLRAGDYTSQVKDQNGCIVNATYTVTEPEPLKITILQGDYIQFCEGADATLEATVNGGTPDYTITWSGSSGTTYQFAAVEDRDISAEVSDNNGCSDEATISVQVNKPYPSEEICIVTINAAGKNMIVWEKSLDVGIVSYNVYKETSAAGSFAYIGSVANGELSVFVDENSKPKSNSDRYKIAAVDTCGNESPRSPFHKTIHLAVTPAVPSGFNLLWDHIEIENSTGDYGTYYIYRGSSYSSLELIDSIASNYNQKLDENPPAGQVYYQISAKKLDACSPNSNSKKALMEDYSQSFSNLEEVVVIGEDLRVAACGLRVYPTPFTEATTLEFPNPDHSPYRLVVTDMAGKIVREEGMITGERYELRRDGLESGIYIVEMIGQAVYRAIITIN